LTESSFFLGIEKASSRLMSALGLSRGYFRWLLLPVLFLFLTIQLAFNRPTLFTTHLPLVISLTFFLCLFYKTKGLWISYFVLLSIILHFYKELPPEENLWQMGILLTLAVTLFITLLSIEKVEEEELLVQKKSEENEQKCTDLKYRYLHDERKYNNYIDSLKETVQELIREVEQRRIEKRSIAEEQERLQNEIGRLTEQNRALVVDLCEARAEARQSSARYEQLAERPLYDGYQERFETSQNTITELENKIVCIQKESLVRYEEWQHRVAELEGRYKQMRAQFEEKKAILDKTRQELFEIETTLMASEREEKKECEVMREMEAMLITIV